jgi:hypothetical protein
VIIPAATPPATIRPAPGVDLSHFAGRIDPATVGRPADGEHRPTFVDRVDISPVGEAEWAGFELGCNGFAVVGPAHYSPAELAAFHRGHAAGFKAYEEAEAAEWQEELERQDEAFGDPADRFHDVEVIEARGAVEARRER